MSERKAWSEQEDEVLKILREQRGITKWAEISRLMQEEFKLEGRNGKQCRQRYHNHLDKRIKRSEWLPQQENDLIELHNNVGNRWAEISRDITGRSQNCVKNKFYSILRRGLRYINKVIKKHLKKYKQLNISVVYKLIEACEPIYRRRHPTKEMELYLDLKKQIIFYGMKKEKQPQLDEDVEKIRTLIQQLKNFYKTTNSKTSNSKTSSTKKQLQESEEMSEEEPESIKEEADQVDPPIYVFKPQPKKTSLESMLGDVDFNDPMRSGRSNKSSYSSFRSRNLSNISNPSGKQRQSFMRVNQLNPMDTIKSLQFPEFQPIKQPPGLLMMQSIYFDNSKSNNKYDSLSQLLPN